MADPASADPAAEKLKNLSLQDYDSSAAEFDPFAPQGQTNNIQHGDLISGADNFHMDNNMAGYTNGHGGVRIVSFDDALFGLPDPGFVKPENQGQGQQLGNVRNMSMAELQTDYGNTGNLNTGQMEYSCVSDDDDDENNLVDLGGPGDPETPPANAGAQGDQDYYMSTGQPLVDDMHMAPSGGHPTDGLMVDNFEQFSGQDSSQFQNVHDMAAANQMAHGVPDIEQPANLGPEEEFYDGYYQDNEDIEGNTVDQAHLYPQMDDAERMRRSLSPERSLSPDHSRECAGSVEQQCDSNDTETECANFQNSQVAEPAITESEIPKRTKPSGIPSKSSSPARSIPSQDSERPSETKASPKHKVGQIPILQPSPKLKKRPLALPPWNDNNIVPLMRRARPTLIGKQSDVVSPPARPKTAPVRHTVKDASSDSGVEEDRTTDVRKNSGDSGRKYGTNTQNQTYKPGGGNVKIFTQKVDTHHGVGSRTDSTKPRMAFSPHGSHTSLKSPSPSKPPSPSVRNVSSKIGSLKNAQHSPGGGHVTILSQQKNYSNVSSRVASKTDHTPKGGDKKIEVKKLEWKAESKVGSLKNATHSPGGGNIKDGETEEDARGRGHQELLKPRVDTRANIRYVPGGGNVIELYDEDLDWDADAKVHSLDNIDYQPGGGRVRIADQRPTWSARSRIGSLENARHSPGGGKVKVYDQKMEVKAQPKVGSTANIRHKAGGGDKKIETQKLEFKDKAAPKVGSLDKVHHQPGGGDIKVRDEKLSWTTGSRIGSLENAKHVPGSGHVKVIDEKVTWTAGSRIGSLENAKHVAGGGHVKILDEKVDFSVVAESKVGSMEKVKHQPGGGDKKIETQKLTFKETAQARTDSGPGSGAVKPRTSSSRSSRSDSVTSQDSRSITE